MKKVILRHMRATGDCLVLSAIINALHTCYPNKFLIGVISCYPEIFYNNPNITKLIFNGKIPDDVVLIDIDYAEKRNKEGYENLNYSQTFLKVLQEILGCDFSELLIAGFPNMFPKIYLTDKEKAEDVLYQLGIKKSYWVLNAGSKMDIPLKQYPPELWQEVINLLNDSGVQVVQAGHSHHLQPLFKNCVNLVGKTNNLRDYFSLMYHAQGSVGGVSLHVHTAAAFDKPCVVVAGGREDQHWAKYYNHRFLHTIGRLDCCKTGGCWYSQRSECVCLNRYPECMYLIKPKEIVDNILSYERD